MTNAYAGVFASAGTSGHGLIIRKDLWWVGNASYYSLQIVSGNQFPDLNVWYHVAVTRDSSNVVRGFVNGEQVGSVTDATSSWTESFVLGQGYLSDTSYPSGGYFSDVRINVGTAEYTSDFTPPTQLKSTPNEVHLKAVDAGIFDRSQTAETLTLNGDVVSSTTQTKYATSSIVVDGTGDGLLIPGEGRLSKDIALPNDFTVEFWVYPTGWNTSAAFLSLGHGSSYSPFVVYSYSGYSDLRFFASSNGTSWNLQSVAATNITQWTNSWKHFAMTYDASATTVKLWLDGTLTATYTNIDGWENGGGGTNWTIATNEISASAFSGYIEDARISTGIVRYTSNFTPPSSSLKG